MKRERQVIPTRQSSTNDAIIKEKLVKNTRNGNDDEEIDSELEALEQDYQDIEIAVEEIKILESFSTNAKIALESSLLTNFSAATSSTTLKKPRSNNIGRKRSYTDHSRSNTATVYGDRLLS